jgi:hypothetical protein
MRKIFSLALIIMLAPIFSAGQKVEISAFGGYVFANTMHGSNGTSVYIHDFAQYGGQLSVAISRVVDLDIIYNRSDTKVDVTGGYSYNDLDVPTSINYMQLGGTKNFRVNPTISPFVGLNIGACLMAPKEIYPDYWFFSVGMNAGAKFYLSDRLGFRLQAQGYIPIQGAGFTMYAGTGGAGSGVSVYSTIFQFGFTGGLVFRLGRLTPSSPY